MDAASTFRWLDQIADDRDLPPIAARVAIVLRRYVNSRSGAAWPSQARLVEVTGLSRSGLQNALRALVAQGHLSVEVQKGRGSTNEYRPAFLERNAHEGEHYSTENAHEREHYTGENAHQRGQGVPTSVGRGAHQRGQGVPTSVGIELLERNLRENSSIELTASLAADSNDRSSGKLNSEEVEDAFSQFYAAYPRRTAKGAARRAFATALKKSDTATLIAGARRYAGATIQTDPKFIKHPATWLNGECWLDEADPASRAVIDADGNEVVTPESAAHGGRRKTPAEQIDEFLPRIASGEMRPPW